MSGKASLLWILIAAAITAGFSAVMAMPFFLGCRLKDGYFSSDAFLYPFALWSTLGGLGSGYFLIELALEEPSSWLGKLASGLFGLAIIISVPAALLVAVIGLRTLFLKDFQIFAVVTGAIAYAISYRLLLNKNKRNLLS